MWNNQFLKSIIGMLALESPCTPAVIVLCLSGHNEKVANKNIQVKRSLWEQRNMFGARIKNMSKEELVDPPFHYIITIFDLINGGILSDY